MHRAVLCSYARLVGVIVTWTRHASYYSQLYCLAAALLTRPQHTHTPTLRRPFPLLSLSFFWPATTHARTNLAGGGHRRPPTTATTAATDAAEPAAAAQGRDAGAAAVVIDWGV